jgi:hypothetical protein
MDFGAHLAIQLLMGTGATMGIVAINPVIDEHNGTALLAVELTLSGLKKILSFAGFRVGRASWGNDAR